MGEAVAYGDVERGMSTTFLVLMLNSGGRPGGDGGNGITDSFLASDENAEREVMKKDWDETARKLCMYYTRKGNVCFAL